MRISVLGTRRVALLLVLWMTSARMTSAHHSPPPIETRRARANQTLHIIEYDCYICIYRKIQTVLLNGAITISFRILAHDGSRANGLLQYPKICVSP